jgi:hypothetical protein
VNLNEIICFNTVNVRLHWAVQVLDSVEFFDSGDVSIFFADVLSSAHALSVVNILHNALTLYKRVVGSKQQCSPSQR